MLKKKKKKSHANDVFILIKVTLTLTFEERLVSERDVSILGKKRHRLVHSWYMNWDRNNVTKDARSNGLYKIVFFFLVIVVLNTNYEYIKKKTQGQTHLPSPCVKK